MSSPDLLSALAERFPADRLLVQPGQLAVYESDALTAYRSRPVAVVIPETQEEVIEAVRLCHRYGVPFVARGSGTSLSGGSLPIKDGMVIALNRLNRILRLDPKERIAVVEPGVINLDVSKAARPYGLYYAPDPSSQSICTIGGNVAFNSGGAHCLKYGMTATTCSASRPCCPTAKSSTWAATAWRGPGRTWWGCSSAPKGCSASRWRSRCACCRSPRRTARCWPPTTSLEAAGNAVAQVVASGLLPGAMEIMDRLAIQAAEAAVSCGYPRDAAALLIVELEGETSRGRRRVRAPEEIIRASGAYEMRVRAGRRRPGADLEGAQERLLRRGPPQPRLHRAGRRRAAHPPGRGAGRDRAPERSPTASAWPTSSMPATATCTR